MKFTAKYELLKGYTGAMYNPTDEIKITLTDEEGTRLQELVSYLEIYNSHIGELAWFMEKAKELKVNEDNESKSINELRDILYRPKFKGEPPQTEEEAEHINKIWNEYNKSKKALTEKEKLERDRKFYQEYKSACIALRSGEIQDLKSIDLFFGNGKKAKISEKYLLKLVEQDLKKKYLQPLELLIDIIGENKNVETKLKRNRKEFAQNFYQFLSWNVVNKGTIKDDKFEYQVSDYDTYNLIAGILFFAGLERPSSDTDTLSYEIGKNNEEYRKYVSETLLGLRKKPTVEDNLSKILTYDANDKRKKAKKKIYF
jgi:hypothetical protein